MWFLIIAVVAIVAIVVFKTNNSKDYYDSKNVKSKPPNFRNHKYFGACMSCDCGEYLNAETRKCCKYNVLVSSDSVCDSYSDKEINGLAEIIMGKPDKK